jgi:hypothetical protein
MMNAMHSLRILAIAGALTPCFRGEAARVSSSAQPTNTVYSFVGTNLCDVALAVVDGKPLTAAEVKDAVLVAAKSHSLSKGLKKAAAPTGRRANLMAMRLTPQLISSLVLENELDRRRLVSTKESDAEVLARYNKKFNCNAKTPEELCALFGDLAPAFRRQFARESRYREMFSRESELKVAKTDIDKYYSDLSNRIARCAMINQRATNNLEQAWNELASGVPWDVVATNYTEDALLEESFADNWKDWMSLDLKKIEPMELMVAISKLKPGEYTKPIDTDDGLVIVKLVDRDGDFCSLARILARMAVKVDIPDHAAAENAVRKKKEVEFQKEILAKLRKNANIHYPFGKKFAFKIWEEPVRRQRKAPVGGKVDAAKKANGK